MPSHTYTLILSSRDLALLSDAIEHALDFGPLSTEDAAAVGRLARRLDLLGRTPDPEPTPKLYRERLER